jgi:hypothetical protein
MKHAASRWVFSETSVYLHWTSGRYIPRGRTIWHVTPVTSIVIGYSAFMKLSSWRKMCQRFVADFDLVWRSYVSVLLLTLISRDVHMSAFCCWPWSRVTFICRRSVADLISCYVHMSAFLCWLWSRVTFICQRSIADFDLVWRSYVSVLLLTLILCDVHMSALCCWLDLVLLSYVSV